MKKLQAAMRDASAKRARVNRGMFKVGGAFKGCAHCGEWYTKIIGGRPRKIYTSGYDVFRSYDPGFVGWTFYCFTCSAKDLDAWENDADGNVKASLGKPPIMGTRPAKAGDTEYLEKQFGRGNESAAVVRPTKPAVAVTFNPAPAKLSKSFQDEARDEELKKLQRDLDALMSMLKLREGK